METRDVPVLHFFVGKIAAGKSTLAAKLSQAPSTVVISEDEWLFRLYGDDMKSIEDYVRNARRLRDVLGPHLMALLRGGLSVVADFQANTIEARLWMREIYKNAGAGHVLHFLDVPEEVCRGRLHRRNADGNHPFAPTDEQFDRITQHFVPPSEGERFIIKRYGPGTGG